MNKRFSALVLALFLVTIYTAIAAFPKAEASTPSPQTIEIFVTSWCPYCKSLEAFLTNKKIAFKKYDVEKDRVGYEKFQALGGGGVPVTKIGSSILRGFDPFALSAELSRLQSQRPTSNETLL